MHSRFSVLFILPKLHLQMVQCVNTHCEAYCIMQDCGAIALDSTGRDISSSIVAVDVTPCRNGTVCSACDITYAAAGLCLPGSYLYLYRYAIWQSVAVKAVSLHAVDVAPNHLLVPEFEVT